MKGKIVFPPIIILFSLLLQSCVTGERPVSHGLVSVESPVPRKLAQVGTVSLAIKDIGEAWKALYLNVEEGDDSDRDGIPEFADFKMDSGSDGIRKFTPFKIRLDSRIPESAVTFILRYPESPPEDLRKISGETLWDRMKFWDDGRRKFKDYSFTPGFRVWRKNSSVLIPRSVKDGGDYLPSGIELYSGEMEMNSNTTELFLEALPGSEEIPEPYLQVEIYLKKDLPFPKTDSCRIVIAPLRLQIITKGVNGEIIPCAKVPLSKNPLPVVRLEEITKDDIKIQDGTAVFKLQGYVTDPFAENVPHGRADIKELEIRESPLYSNNQMGIICSPVLEKTDAGPKSLWKQCPYKAKFGPVEVRIRLHYGKQIIRAVTGRNAAGLEGYDEVCLECLPPDEGDDDAPSIIKIINGPGSGEGSSAPFTMRAKGLPGGLDGYLFYLDKMAFPLMEKDGWIYPGSSKDDYVNIMFMTADGVSSGMEIRRLYLGKNREFDEFMVKVNGYLKKGELEEARKMVYDAAAKGDPNGQYIMGLFYNVGIGVVKDRKSAYKWFEKAAAGGSAAAQNDLAYMICEEKGDLDKALDLVMKALEKEPENGCYLDTAGKILFEKGRYKEAIENLRKANDLVPNHPEHQENLADTYFKLNEREKAREYWSKALENSKDSAQQQRLKRKLAGNPAEE